MPRQMSFFTCRVPRAIGFVDDSDVTRDTRPGPTRNPHGNHGTTDVGVWALLAQEAQAEADAC